MTDEIWEKEESVEGNAPRNLANVSASELADAIYEILDNKKVLQEVTDEVIESITAAYNENSPDFIYFVTLYNIFNIKLSQYLKFVRIFKGDLRYNEYNYIEK